jgi:hypothetical protein
MSRLNELSQPRLKSIWPRVGDLARAERRSTLSSPDGSISITETAEGQALQARGGGGSIVRITSGGPGNAYVGDVYGKGPSEAATATDVDLYQLQANAAATIPAGTWAIGVKIGDVYYMQVPVWL